MSGAYRCDLCGEMMEGEPEMFPEEPSHVVVHNKGFTINQNDILVLLGPTLASDCADLCWPCLRQIMQTWAAAL